MESRIEQNLPRRRRARIETGLAAVLFVVLLLQVGLRVHLLERGYDIAAIQDELLEYDAQLRQLRADRASLLRAERLETVAAKHGLSALENGQIRYMQEGGEA